MNRTPLALIIMFIIALLGCVASPLLAESALSSLGYGLINYSTNTRGVGMGFLSITSRDTMGLNTRTIALWEGKATTRFQIEGLQNRTITSDNYGESSSDEINIVSATLAVPLKGNKFIGLAITPVTRMNYRWTTENTAGWTQINERHTGRGGITQGILGLSTPLGDKIRLGIGGRMLMGKIERYWRVEFPDVAATQASITTSERFRGAGFTLSSRYLLDKQNAFSVLINSPIELWTEQQSIIQSGSSNRTDTTARVTPGYDTPWELVLGYGINIKRHHLGVEYEWDNWVSVSKSSNFTDRLTDAHRVSFGWEYKPEFRPFDAVWKIPAYRAGFYYKRHYILDTSGNPFNGLGFSAGLSLPYNRNQSRVDLAIQFGWLGDSVDNNLRERTVNISLSFINSEQWFIGRRAKR